MISLLIVIMIALFVIFLTSFVLFRIIFYVPPRKKLDLRKIDLPSGKIYEPFYDSMREWVMNARKTPHETFSITSFDGLKLFGNYYEFAPDAPIELMFHGYRGTAERDMAGGIHRAFQIGHSVLLVDQRCSGRSEGNVITFGINEHRDCLRWIDFIVEHFARMQKLF